MATATMSPSAATPSSASAPEIHSRHTMASNGLIPSPSLDAFLAPSPRIASPDTLPASGSPKSADVSSFGSNIESSLDPDAQIIEALRSKDRLYVLKLGEQMESLITDGGTRLILSPSTSYQRMLVHRCSAYYRLQPESDVATKGIAVYCRTESRIPSRRICDLVPLEEAAQPTIKIMRRSTNETSKSRQNSQAGSVVGEEADSSDVDEAGSIVSGRSAATGSSAKRHLTLEEREAAYNEARSRIFMDFEEKEQAKEKDMSANSSTFSLVSGSASTSGGGRGSSIDDLDDSASSAATESEWSGPVARDKRDGRRGGSGGSSSRSLRSSNTSYHANGSGSSRDSRATSPSFAYASLYEPPPVDVPYGNTPSGYMPPYMYPYGPAPGHVPTSPPYGYPYFMSYGYQPPPDSASPSPHDSLYPTQNPPPPMGYMPQYGWPHAPQPPAYPPTQTPYPHSPGNGGLTLPPQASQPSSPQPQTAPPPSSYASYFPQHQYNPYATYPPPMAYQPPGQYAPPPAQLYVPDVAANGPGGYMNGGGSGTGSSNHSRASSRSSHNGTAKRGAPRARASWSYGPGAGNNGYTYNLNSIGPPMGGSETVGPRLSSSTRRVPTTSSASGSAGVRTPGDETSSTTSSSTTSSRTTYTSTSSKHPLPPRPDWAVGLKAEPVLHATRHHHDHSNANSRNMSPARLGGQNQHQPQPALQPTDFPPLSSAPERRAPAVAGAWTNASSTRSIIMAGAQGGTSPQGKALVHHANAPQPAGSRMEDHESGFDRPSPNGNAELFNPTGTPRLPVPMRMGPGEMTETPKQKGPTKEDAVSVAGLVERAGRVSLEDRSSDVESAPNAARNGGPSPSPATGAEGNENRGDL